MKHLNLQNDNNKLKNNPVMNTSQGVPVRMAEIRTIW